MKTLYCITCPTGCQLTIIGLGFDMVVEGNKCKRGREFAEAEMENPTRTLTTTCNNRRPVSHTAAEGAAAWTVYN